VNAVYFVKYNLVGSGFFATPLLPSGIYGKYANYFNIVFNSGIEELRSRIFHMALLESDNDPAAMGPYAWRLHALK